MTLMLQKPPAQQRTLQTSNFVIFSIFGDDFVVRGSGSGSETWVLTVLD
jgi:hypothetical protein